MAQVDIPSNTPSDPDVMTLEGNGILMTFPVPAYSNRTLAVLVLIFGLIGWLVLFRERRSPGRWS